MIKSQTNNSLNIADSNFKKLSIQVSLNGLSFCVSDSVTQKILIADDLNFKEKQTPIFVLDELIKLVEKHQLEHTHFNEVILIHKNTLFGLVPKSLFNPNHLSNYLKLNTKLLPTDVLSFDEIEHQDLINVYVPYMNINNYIYELFGEFTYMHNGTVLIDSLINKQNQDNGNSCYVYVSKHQLDITVLKQRKLTFYNSFEFETTEDFIYYLLFVMEQLELDTNHAVVNLFGAIEEGDAIHQICHKYIKNSNIYEPEIAKLEGLNNTVLETLDYTLKTTL